MSDRRFIVSTVSGHNRKPTCFYVNDSVYLYRVVAKFEGTRGVPNALCRYRAERLRDTLNQWAATA